MKPRSALFWSSAAILLCFTFSSGFELDTNGGYKIVVAVEQSVVAPATPELLQEFVNNIKTGFNVFSNKLWEATRQRFHLTAVDLILPTSWTVGVGSLDPPTQQATTAHSVASSQIRISAPKSYPFVENPHPCGVAGKYIRLPQDFFDEPNTDNGPFGSAVKALLTQWARYRYGVWEEHGYPTENQFPYSYYQNVWKPSTCSADVQGVYETMDDIPVPCPVDGVAAPGPECRFKPNLDTEVTSSLMSFHWLESVNQFCDDDTHNKLAPNRQNQFCNYRSVWNVIKSTADFKVVEAHEPPTQIKPPNFRTVQHKTEDGVVKTRPALYVLLDKGYIEEGGNEHEILRTFLPILSSNLFGTGHEHPLPDDMSVAAGVFPGDIGVLTTGHPFKDLGVPSSGVDGYREELIDYFEKITLNGEFSRDFAGAISQVIHEIETLSPENGAMILVVKTGAPRTAFFEKEIAFEAEIETALHKNNIKLFAVEIAASGDTATHLETLTDRTAGAHVELTDTNKDVVVAAANTIADKMFLAWDKPGGVKENHVVVRREFVALNAEVTPIDVSRDAEVTVTLVVPFERTARLLIDGEEISELSKEWDSDFRHVIVHIHEYNPQKPTLTVKYICKDPNACQGTEGLLLVTEKYIGTTATQGVLPELARVKVTVVSRPETSIDYSTDKIPYAVNAKVELDGKPVKNAIIEGFATYTPNGTETDVPVTIQFSLLDDGLGHPDATKFDGVYSASFVPPIDAEYSISLVVQNGDIPTFVPKPYLMPIDQEFPDLEDDTTYFTQEFTIPDIQLPAVAFVHVNSYPGRGKPEKISDFSVYRNVALTGVRFEFTSPRIIGGGPDAKATRYVIYGAETFEELLPTSAPGIRAKQPVLEVNNVEPVGQPEIHGVDTLAVDYDYYSITSFVENLETDFHTIVPIGKHPGGGGGGPTSSTTTTTTTSSSSTSTTTEKPEGGTPFFESPGGIVLIVFLVLLGVGAIGGGGFWYYRKQKAGRGYRSGV